MTKANSPVLQNPAVMRRMQLQANLTVVMPQANCSRMAWSPQILGARKSQPMNWRVGKVPKKHPGGGRQKIANSTYCVCTASACTNAAS